MSTVRSRTARLPEAGAERTGSAADTAPTAAAGGAAPAGSVLTREVLAPAIVVVLGSIMTILDATIVNVALPALGRDLHTSISTIQWVPTIYLLAFVSVIRSPGGPPAGSGPSQCGWPPSGCS